MIHFLDKEELQTLRNRMQVYHTLLEKKKKESKDKLPVFFSNASMKGSGGWF